MLMPEFFANPQNFTDHIKNEGHKQYYLSTINAYLQSLLDLDTLYRLQALPSHLNENNCSQASAPINLEGNQLVALTLVKDMIREREQFNESYGQIAMCPSDVDWRRFLLILGKAGTGKTFTMQQLIQYCLDNMLSVAVAVPTGTLACTYRERYQELVTCDTLHGFFNFSSDNNNGSRINWNIAMYDIIFIDEISQVSVEMFHHIISTVDKVIRRPLVVMCGDFAQQQPISTVNNETRQVSNISSCQHCLSFLVRVTLTTQHRTDDTHLVSFLQHIRFFKPTDEMLSTIMDGRILLPNRIIDSSLYEKLRQHPEATILTMTKRAAMYINEIIITSAFSSSPICVVLMDDESLIPVHKSTRLIITQNINKQIGFVNGQFINVVAVRNNTIIACTSSGAILNIHPITKKVDDREITVYPCLPGYANTICKAQGQTLNKVVLWIDTERTPPGTAYVAFSRVKRLSDLYFLTELFPQQFTPVTQETI